MLTGKENKMVSDARVRYTKMMIQDSFVKLVQGKKFSKITLKEVCNLAGINPSTFYRHYKDIFDWKDQFESSFIEKVESFINNSDKQDIHSILSAQLRDFQNNKEVYTMIASDNFESNLLNRLCLFFIHMAETALKEFNSKDIQTVQQWNCHYAVYGAEGVIRCWVNNGMTEPVEKVIEYIISRVYDNLNYKF